MKRLAIFGALSIAALHGQPREWPAYGGGPQNIRYSTLS